MQSEAKPMRPASPISANRKNNGFVPDEQGSRGAPTTLLSIVLVVAALYFARVVFIPLALAVLVAFILSPMVHYLTRRGLWRVPSVLAVVFFSFILLGIIGAVMVSQLGDLASKLPEYQENTHKKLQAIGKSGGGVVNQVARWTHDLAAEVTPSAPAAQPGAQQPKDQAGQEQAKEEKPVPVEIKHSKLAPMELIQTVLGSIVSILMTALIVIVFVIFMLIQEEDLRGRLTRLSGRGSATVTSKVLDDAAIRLSRYLSAQLAINVGYGVLVGSALHFVGTKVAETTTRNQGLKTNTVKGPTRRIGPSMDQGLAAR
jgi:predicted PurR-regulated permease PerM